MDFPVIFLLLISSLIPLWSESRHWMISILLNVIRCVLWPEPPPLSLRGALGSKQGVRPRAAGPPRRGHLPVHPRCFSSHTPARSGPVRGVETAAVSRQHLHTECLSPFFLGPAHLRTKQVFRKSFHASVIPTIY